jgi:hypothetical protein
MGNWRTVNMVGTVSEAEADRLRDRLRYSYADGFDWANFGPLSFNTEQPGLCSLGDWVQPTISACGNLVTLAPSLRMKVHCGADWESSECIATVTVEDGAVRVGAPEVGTVAGPSEDEMRGRLFTNIMRRSR